MKLTAKNHYALICDSGYKKDTPLLCGTYSTKKEAVAVAKEVKDCPCKHFVKRVSVTANTY